MHMRVNHATTTHLAPIVVDVLDVRAGERGGVAVDGERVCLVAVDGTVRLGLHDHADRGGVVEVRAHPIRHADDDLVRGRVLA